MSKEPKISANLDEDPGYGDVLGDALDEYNHRDRISFGTNLNAGLKEKLKTISHDEDIPIVELVNKAVRNLIEDLEEENGEYEVYEPFRVEE